MAKRNKMVTLKNNFHNTEITVRRTSAEMLGRYRYDLTRSQRRTVDRIRAKLCGSSECTCGVVRGPQ